MSCDCKNSFKCIHLHYATYCDTVTFYVFSVYGTVITKFIILACFHHKQQTITCLLSKVVNLSLEILHRDRRRHLRFPLHCSQESMNEQTGCLSGVNQRAATMVLMLNSSPNPGAAIFYTPTSAPTHLVSVALISPSLSVCLDPVSPVCNLHLLTPDRTSRGCHSLRKVMAFTLAM